MIKADAGLYKAKRRASSQYTESGEKLPNVCSYQERAKEQVSAVNDADCPCTTLQRRLRLITSVVVYGLQPHAGHLEIPRAAEEPGSIGREG